VLLVAAAALAFGVPHARAWLQLRSARTALEQYQPWRAREALADCVEIWPERAAVRLLASRAARQMADFEEADRQLRAGHRLSGGATEEVAFEWALLQAAAGNPLEVEEFLNRRVERDPASAPLVWEALAEGYIRLYRILDALQCLDHWLALDPQNLRALELRGLAFMNGKSTHKAAQDFRRVIELDPARDATRQHLAFCLLDMGAYSEATTHLEHARRQRPGDPEVLVKAARCHYMLGQREQARSLIDEALANQPGHGLALRTRAQFALAEHDPARAEAALREALETIPSDYQVRWMLVQALQQQGKGEEASSELKLAERAKERAERLGELTSRKLSEQPLDPALHYEMGMLLIGQGNADVGERWLVTALSLDPDFAPAHAALAEYYERQGDSARAARHRLRASSPSP
jgi:tetratricopeptide (TPR) repeat protein